MFLRRLKDLRTDNDLTQKDVGKILSITNRQYGRYERGERDMPIDLLRILAKYYTVSIDYLVEDTDISKRYPPPKKTSKV